MREFKNLFKASKGAERAAADFFHGNSSLDAVTIQTFARRVADYADSGPATTAALDRFPFSEKIPLPPASGGLAPVNLKKLLARRRSRRTFSARPVTRRELARLLRYSYGRVAAGDTLFSAIPSAGALYPLRVYIFSFSTELAPGLYHYYFRNEFLDKLPAPGGLSRLPQMIMADNLQGVPALYLCITADLGEISRKYGERGYRFALIEAGHLAQNLLLVGEYLRLAAVPLGGFYDAELARYIGCDFAVEKPVYVIAFGK